ncbi:hypothetical protein HMPREF1552_00928 [Leptotrichia sp. oral taxon 879 str. F0557]|nr:hypothetical protein HMPREF1552_00928 [Leptotrichia sp. oral taxon 879 str. F0557]
MTFLIKVNCKRKRLQKLDNNRIYIIKEKKPFQKVEKIKNLRYCINIIL